MVTNGVGNVILEVIAGDCLADKIGDARQMVANHPSRIVEFEFNGITVLASAMTDWDALERDYWRALRGYLGDRKTIGPVYATELAAEDVANDTAIAAEQSRRSAEEDARLRDSRNTAAELLRGALLVAPALELRDKAFWEQVEKANAESDFGMRVMKYAEDVGRLLQTRHQARNDASLSMAATIVDDLQEVERLADDDGITGAMHTLAMGLLCRCWLYGDELRAAM